MEDTGAVESARLGAGAVGLGAWSVLQTSLHRVIEDEARPSPDCCEDWTALGGAGTTDRVDMATDPHLGVSIGDLVGPAGWIGPASGGCRSGRRHASLPCHALHSPLPGASLTNRSGPAPRPGMRTVRSISASMRPSREQPAAAPSPEAIHLGGTDVTKSGSPARCGLGGWLALETTRR